MSAVEKFPILLSDAEEESSAVPPCFSHEGINVCFARNRIGFRTCSPPVPAVRFPSFIPYNLPPLLRHLILGPGGHWPFLLNLLINRGVSSISISATATFTSSR